jgi:hypothetical protein
VTQGEGMTIQPDEPHVTRLLSYALASADMYYTEMERRDIFLSCDQQGRFCIWGKTADGEPSTRIDLFQIFLEYALYCCSWASAEDILCNMQAFGERLGRSLAKQLENNIRPSISHRSASQILKYIFETVDTHPFVENVDAGVCVIVMDSPLKKAAKRSGLWNIELARSGINSMCQNLIRCLNPSFVVSVSSDVHSEFAFTILMPAYT